MREQVEKYGIDRGRALVRETVAENGVPCAGVSCVSCDAAAVWVEWSGLPECASCAVHNLRECEMRWGTVSEFAAMYIYDIGPSEYRRRVRFESVIMAGVFAGIAAELAEHREPCDECGAVMTWRGDTWSHEDTATADTCYTAYRWGVK